MLAVDHHQRATHVQVVDQRVGDLGGQAFLNLRALRKDVDEPRDLAQPCDVPGFRWDVGDVGEAVKRQ
ncbi:hypothetical protein SDC9_79573 [bioreactor metagenome]|uniref:Uncharacterized protein n=1 Tax=bioreactor metagenome TaxID=1076179 RepID=A0A644YWT8_9ZZZZ